MNRFVFGLLALATTAALFAQEAPDKDVSWRARGEIARRGAMVEYVDGYGGESPIGDVMQLPADDSGKWVLTLVTTKGCAYCDKLRADFETSAALKSWVDTTDHKKSWAHWQIVQIEDKSQEWRWKNFRPTRFPTLLVQPPPDRSWGDPHVVVFRQEGYDGRPEKLDASLRKTISAYALKVNKQHAAWKTANARRIESNGGAAQSGSDEGGMGQKPAESEGTGQYGGWNPPAPPVPPLGPPNVQPNMVQPNLPLPPSTYPPNQPPADPTLGPSDKVAEWVTGLVVSLLSAVFPDAKTILLFLTALSNVWLLMRDRARQAGVPLLLSDATAAQVAEVLKKAAEQSKTSPTLGSVSVSAT